MWRRAARRQQALNTFTDGNVTLHLATTENVASMTVFFQRYDGSSDSTGTVALTSSIAVSTVPGYKREHAYEKPLQ